jgi:hypothetical protein
MKAWIAVLGILGGIAGIVSGFLVTAGGEFFGEETMSNDGVTVFWLSILAIFFSFLSWINKIKIVCGVLLIITALTGFILNGLFFTFAFIFLLIAGVLSIVRKEKKSAQAEVQS